MPLSSGTHLGPYKILEPLGAGGMGEVYRARDSRLDRDVAIKVLPEHLAQDPVALKRFEREAKAVAALSHENILAIYEFDSEEDVSFVVTELLQGETLRTRIQSPAFSSREALEIAVEIAEGLSAAHAKGIIHRDLKPENVFLTSNGRAKILDFGLARLKPVFSQEAMTHAPTKSVETEAGILIGTLPYMSPEQVRGEDVDARSDIFSFGCVLYEMLTSKRAFSGATPADTVSAILNEDPLESPELAGEIDPQLCALLRHCLEKKRDQRFQSAHDIAFALREISGSTGSSKAVSAKHPSQRLSAGRFRAVILVSLGVLSLVALLFGLNVGDLRERFVGGDSSAPIESLAVLPLANLSGDPEQEYFSDGMTEALITDLAKIQALKVISRTSVMQYKSTEKSLRQIADELGVDAVVEGSVLRSKNRVRITAQLIDADTDQNLWADRYERDLVDVLSLQSQIAQAIAAEIEVAVTPQEKRRLAEARTINPEAYEAYLKGRHFLLTFTRDGVQKGLEYMDLAISKQPDWAVPYAAQAEVYGVSAVFGTAPPREVLPKAEAAALRAIELDDTLSDAHRSYGWVKLWKDWDWSEAEHEFLRAIELNPNSADAYWGYSNSLSVLGRQDEALSAVRRARQLDPLSPLTNLGLGWQLINSRRYDDAIEQAHRMIEMDPNFAESYNILAWSYWHKETFNEALSAWMKHFTLLGWTEGAEALKSGNKKSGFQGAFRQAAQALTKFPYMAASTFANFYLLAQDKDQALHWLEKAYEEHEPEFIYLSARPCWDSLRSDPRYQDLVRRIGLPQ